jgi:hypothetical protein
VMVANLHSCAPGQKKTKHCQIYQDAFFLVC